MVVVNIDDLHKYTRIEQKNQNLASIFLSKTLSLKRAWRRFGPILEWALIDNEAPHKRARRFS